MTASQQHAPASVEGQAGSDSRAGGASGWDFFDTCLGRCAVAWGAHGIVALQLPEATDAATRARLLGAKSALVQMPAPAAVVAATQAIADALRTGTQAPDTVELDMSGVTAFQRRVYTLALRIAPGQTCTYGELAAQLGGRHLARAVGQALGRNPFAPVVPCHRILAASGRPGGFSAAGGVATKLRMLQAEGACRGEQAVLFDCTAGPVPTAAPDQCAAPAQRGPQPDPCP